MYRVISYSGDAGIHSKSFDTQSDAYEFWLSIVNDGITASLSFVPIPPVILSAA